MPVTAAPRRWLVVLVAVACFAVAWSAVFIGGAGTASAHESLTASEPADGAVLAASPDQLTLEFSAAPDVDQVGVVLRSVTGAEVVTGQPSADGTALIVGLLEPLPNGVYTMEWSGDFGDGHMVGSTLSFTVQAAADAAAQASGAPGGGADEASSGGSAEDDGTPAWPWIGAAALLVAGGGAFLLRRRRAG